jgi:formamidopyrimidine-DNA glycosylase
MPELPEVETTRRGISPYLIGHRIQQLVVREPRLRWRIPASLPRKLAGQFVRAVNRRAKYLILDLDDGHLLCHLGMSGSLRIVEPTSPPRKHDHIDIVLDSGKALRLHDPRRFGALLWTANPNTHALIKNLGPEPWEATAEYLHQRSRGRRQAVKNYIMDSRTLVGVGNIYAAEALFAAGIHPKRPAGRLSLKRYQTLLKAVVKVLERSIKMGGTTLRDFVSAEGEPGYFRQALRVYEREGQPCRRCRMPIRRVVLTGRSTYYCPRCQH